MKAKYFLTSVLFGAVTFAAAASEAACGRLSSPSWHQDGFYAAIWQCSQSQINDNWSRFNFHKEDWDGDFGYHAVCDEHTPLKRTLNALHVLAYAATNTPTCSTSHNNVALWAHCWAGNAIDELDGRCGNSPTTLARTLHGPVADNWTQLYHGFYYDTTVVVRASAIFHEARHAHGWCTHTNGCAAGNGACDPNWNSGCVGVGSGSGGGAYAYSVLYLNWFATTARSNYITPAIRQNAIDQANQYLSRNFNSDPCFRLDSNGFPVQTC